MHVLITGSRDWTDVETIATRLTLLPAGTMIMHGAARGADRIAARIARSLGLRVTAYPANWARYGKAAGVIRNRQMLDQRPDLVIAFHPDLTQSRGTADCVRDAHRRGIRVEHITGRSTP